MFPMLLGDPVRAVILGLIVYLIVCLVVIFDGSGPE